MNLFLVSAGLLDTHSETEYVSEQVNHIAISLSLPVCLFRSSISSGST